MLERRLGEMVPTKEKEYAGEVATEQWFQPIEKKYAREVTQSDGTNQ